MPRKLAIAAGLLLFGAAAGAHADYYVYRDVPAWTNENSECWNPHARHFEQVRPGGYQGDLDYSRCRVLADGNFAYGRPYWR
jgi:hypothetical protein